MRPKKGHQKAAGNRDENANKSELNPNAAAKHGENNNGKTKARQTIGESLSLFIARLFPESFAVNGEQITVKDSATETTKARVKAELEQQTERNAARPGKRPRKV